MKPQDHRSALIESRIMTAPVFFLLAATWAIFIQSALQQRNLSWFPFLLGARIALMGLALVLGILALIRPAKNQLPRYLVLCALIQSVFACLESSSQIEYYQYVSYFVFLSSLTFQGTFASWIKRYSALQAFTLVFPLFFKSAAYFSSVGAFAYAFTTPIALALLSIMIVRVVTSKFEALQSNLELRERLLKVSEESKTQLASQLDLARKQIAEDTKRSASAEMALEVAHNLRSPLAALELKLREVEITPPNRASDLRESIHRIRDIANQLVVLGQKARAASTSSKAVKISKERFSDEHVALLVESIISEKRIEYRAKPGIRIEFEHLPESYGLFAHIQVGEMRAILSNLVNNSVEAIGDSGNISIRVRPGAEVGQIAVSVQDDGPGISSQSLENFGERGNSVGKHAGSGIGLAHAKEYAQRWGGLLRITQITPHGTLAEFIIPAVDSPAWFAKNLPLGPQTKFVVVDDDPSIHALWRSKLGSKHVASANSGSQLREWIEQNPTDSVDAHYLVDLDLGDPKEDGLALVRSLGLKRNCTLVTSYYDRIDVNAASRDLDFQIVPKTLAAYISADLPAPGKDLKA